MEGAYGIRGRVGTARAGEGGPSLAKTQKFIKRATRSGSLFAYFFGCQTVRKVVEEPCRLEHRIYGSRYHKKNQNGLRTVHDVFWMFL